LETNLIETAEKQLYALFTVVYTDYKNLFFDEIVNLWVKQPNHKNQNQIYFKNLVFQLFLMINFHDLSSKFYIFYFTKLV
jgi:hypothetical protein